MAFETDGVYYNLGVVDNKQSGKDVADNSYEQIIGFNEEWFKKILSSILLVIALVVLWPLLTPVISLAFNVVLKVFAIVIKVIFKLLLLPPKLIWRLLFPKKE